MESINEDIMVSELAAIKRQFSHFVLDSVIQSERSSFGPDLPV